MEAAILVSGRSSTGVAARVGGVERALLTDRLAKRRGTTQRRAAKRRTGTRQSA
jgi:hypothetical protein